MTDVENGKKSELPQEETKTEKLPNPNWEHVTMIATMILTALRVAELVLKQVAQHNKEKKNDSQTQQ